MDDLGQFSGAGGALLALLAVGLVGRVALAWLPPGAVGAHTARALPLTLATSFVVGLAIVLFAERSARAVGWTSWAGALRVVTGLALALRLATLPGAMVPRHEVRAERPGGAARVVGIAVALAVVGRAWILARAEPPSGLGSLAPVAHFAGVGSANRCALAFTVATTVALFVIVGHGLATARRAPTERRCVLLAIALSAPTAFATADVVLVRLFFAAGCAFAIAWWRRANRREFALAVLAFAACATSPATAPFALAGGVALVVASAGPARRRAWTRAAAGLAVLGAPALATAAAPLASSRSLGRLELAGLVAPGAALVAALVLASLGRTGRRRSRSPSSGIDEPRRELAGLVIGLALAAAPTIRDPSLARPIAAALAPTVWLAAGLGLARSERPRASEAPA